VLREILPQPGAEKPIGIAAMIKREPGFNAKGGNWEFLVLDGSLTKVRERRKGGRCLSCHSQHKQNDFVFPLAEQIP